MSWIQKLHETYEASRESAEPSAMWPVAHVAKKAHVEVAIDGEGNLRRSRKLEWEEATTLIPTTEASAGRTSGDAPHPLCDELSYCALDLPGGDAQRQAGFLAQLEGWVTSAHGHPKASAVLAYIRRGTLWADLQAGQLLPVVTISPTGTKTKVADSKVFVRWRVEGQSGEVGTGVWEDQSLHAAWIAFDDQEHPPIGHCMVTGKGARTAKNHPRFIRSSDDGAKLISANDFEGFTFRGRFTDSKQSRGSQACEVSFEVSQKAHNALRWLIQRQGYRDYESGQTFVAWSVRGAPVPDPFADTLGLLNLVQPADSIETDQAFALRLGKAIAGYGRELRPNDDIALMGLDSATPGRMAITYYREIKGSEFLGRLERWHATIAWPRRASWQRYLTGAPSPREIAAGAFGRWDDRKRRLVVEPRLLAATIERLLPCIVDGREVPRDLVLSTCRRASNRIAFKKNADGFEESWERTLAAACALFRKTHTHEDYQMSLEPDRNNRDYLYGRLLAIADHIEGRALWLADENTRETSAARLMQRFADRPFSTWRTIELSLVPYRQRLKANGGPFLHWIQQRLDEVMGLFNGDDFVKDAPLTGEFLLGYHCQRREFCPPDHQETTPESTESTTT